MSGFHHCPVLLREVVQGLRVRPGGHYLDGTLGGAGHACEILRASGPDGKLDGCDRDPAAVAAATERLASFGGRVELRQGDFADLGDWTSSVSLDGVLFDLGVSSHQLDEPARGFGFQHDGPLDMRMDPSQARTAADVLRTLGEDDLVRILREYGDERQAVRLARAVVAERRERRFETTKQFADFVKHRLRWRGKATIHPATKAFQALRIYLNDELGALARGLEAAWTSLKPAGRLAVITFHSGEARVVKRFGDVLTGRGGPELFGSEEPGPPRLRWVNRRGVAPGPDEIERNPRARSARLRLMEKIGA